MNFIINLWNVLRNFLFHGTGAGLYLFELKNFIIHHSQNNVINYVLDLAEAWCQNSSKQLCRLNYISSVWKLYIIQHIQIIRIVSLTYRKASFERKINSESNACWSISFKIPDWVISGVRYWNNLNTQYEIASNFTHCAISHSLTLFCRLKKLNMTHTFLGFGA